MSYANEMKNLVEDIKVSMKDRVKFVKDNKKIRRICWSIRRGDRKNGKRFKDFLAKNEERRMADFKIVMNECKKQWKQFKTHNKSIG